MKQIKIGISLFMVLSALLTGCGKSDDSDMADPEAAVSPAKSEDTAAAYEYYLTEEELLADIEQGYIFRLETAFQNRPFGPQGTTYIAPYVSEGNWPFYVHEENTVNLEIAFDNLALKHKETIFPMEEQVSVEVISPEGQTVYCFEKTGGEITEDTSIQEQISVTEGSWTLKISFAYVCGDAPSCLKIAAAYETPSEQDIAWLKEQRLGSSDI